MLNKISTYLININRRYQTGISREHSYRGDLQILLEEISPNVLVTNEPARVACGAPDYILTDRNIPVGYIEAKDIGKDLEHKDYKEQFARYRKSLDNLIITDYLDFRLFVDGEFVTSIKIAEIERGIIRPITDNYEQFVSLIKSFCTHIGQTIQSPKKLAEMMAGKAKMLSQVLEVALTGDEDNQEDSTLKEQMNAFREVLIHDITPKEFADIYAQTIAYGMFAARLNDQTLSTFSRQEAALLIPKTNPFLRKLFQYIAGYDLDSRIAWIVDSLADVFRATNVEELLNKFENSTNTQDPIIYFYETFLAEYDPKLRKSRGVWYTPEPIVNFLVRAVDELLKTEFNLPQGLADTSKIKIKINSDVHDQRSKTGYKQIEKDVHKVQILDPATGTGTFLAEVVKQIYQQHFQAMQGAWSGYVENHLIPRLNGFEILMASYSMAHLKLDMILRETGYIQQSGSYKEQRFRIYLTNSLEEFHKDTGTLFASWLSAEANEANHLKRDTPVMVVLGNPPYAVSSSNKGEWIQDLLKDYKKDLNEQNIQPLSDDYIKFIRYGQYCIEKNGSGILAYISNNSFIDGIIHRQMRKNLLETFDKIYILDLHGNAKKKETCPNGSKDENVFDIMQGVSINIFIKNRK
ncbi:MAG: N-6 DNA methylase [Candidatus Marinimicrobia bacterium]|nr:N-6 DNA methylase [Candidatus Neomarinimicrobiota bacterium]